MQIHLGLWNVAENIAILNANVQDEFNGSIMA